MTIVWWIIGILFVGMLMYGATKWIIKGIKDGQYKEVLTISIGIIAVIVILFYANHEGWITGGDSDCTSYDTRQCID